MRRFDGTDEREDHVCPIDHRRPDAAPREIGGRARLPVLRAVGLRVRREQAHGTRAGSECARSGRRCRLSQHAAVRPNARIDASLPGVFLCAVCCARPSTRERFPARERSLTTWIANVPGRGTPARRLLSACTLCAAARQDAGVVFNGQHVRAPLSKSGFDFRRPHHAKAHLCRERFRMARLSG